MIDHLEIVKNISEDKATQKFFSDVQKQYDSKLGFESELQNKKSEVQKNEHMRLQAATLTAMLNDLISQLCQIQSVSGFVEFGVSRQGSKYAKKSVEECCYQGHRYRLVVTQPIAPPTP
jgi:hypothetical protein